MSETEARSEAMRRRDIKRMSLSELEELAAGLRLAAKSLEEAARYESTHRHHPVALKHEEVAEERIDAVILTLARIRSRVVAGPTLTESQIEKYLGEEWKHKDWSYTGGNNSPRCNCGALLDHESPEASLDRHRVRVSVSVALNPDTHAALRAAGEPV